MKINRHIFFLFMLLLAVPTSAALACGNNAETEKTEETSSCQQAKKGCCGNNQDESEDCGGACGNDACHCPVSINIPLFLNDLTSSIQVDFNRVNSMCTYVLHLPKAVYLSIWLPPKIG